MWNFPPPPSLSPPPPHTDTASLHAKGRKRSSAHVLDLPRWTRDPATRRRPRACRAGLGVARLDEVALVPHEHVRAPQVRVVPRDRRNRRVERVGLAPGIDRNSPKF